MEYVWEIVLTVLCLMGLGLLVWCLMGRLAGPAPGQEVPETPAEEAADPEEAPAAPEEPKQDV